jgi:hypothetical protein
MADILDHLRGHNHDGFTSVTDSILDLKEKIDDKELPGLAGLIDDWFDPGVDVDEEQFVRRFLHVFKQSDQDFTYEKILGDYEDDIQSIFNDFVDSKIDAREAARRYYPLTERKTPKQKGDLRKGGLESIVPTQRDILKEHTSLLSLLRSWPSSFPSHLRRLVVKVIPSLKNPTKALYVPVSLVTLLSSNT